MENYKIIARVVMRRKNVYCIVSVDKPSGQEETRHLLSAYLFSPKEC
jgi:hypothetical protein